MKTIVNFILDKSGSMESVREATISGFNEYIQTLKKDKENEYEFTLTLFDTNFVVRDKAQKLSKVKELNKESYNPDGGTALYDGVCSTLKGITEAHDHCNVCGGHQHTTKYVTIIMTDGQENSSREYTQVEMKKMIEEREKQGNWTFVYLGANQDSYAVAQKFGVQVGNIANFNATTAGTSAAYRGMANATVLFAGGGGASSSSFLAANKADIENTK